MYWLELTYGTYDENDVFTPGYDGLGNLTAMTQVSQPHDIDQDQEFTYDRRNRLASWKKGIVTHAYGFDDLGNLTNNGGSAQTFNAATRPHAVQHRASGNATYAYDEDGNVTAILAASGNRYFKFDSANRMVCADSVEGGCALNQVHYDVDGRRVLDDDPMAWQYLAFVDDSVSIEAGIVDVETRIEIHAFGERIAYKRSEASVRTAGVELPFGVPPVALELLGGFAFLGLLAWLAQQGALVLVIQRPGYAGVAAVLVVVLVVGPIPGARVSTAGGGGGASFYWELADPLGTGMVMLDETGARRVHRTYSPFGVQQASVGPASWLPRHYAGHLEDEDSGLVYMQARWMDPQSGTFLSVDSVVANAGDPQSYNAYAYARSNPISLVDPTGAIAIEEITVYGPSWQGVSSHLLTSTYLTLSNLVAGQFVAGEGHVIFANFAGTGGGVSGYPTVLAGINWQDDTEELVYELADSSQGETSPSEIAAIAIFQNREVPEIVVNQIGREELVEFAELRVTIAELTRQPGADRTRLELGLAKSDLTIGLVEIAASLSTSAFGVISPARTPAQIARDLPGVLLGPESQSARQGAQRFLSGLEGIKAIVRSPIGTPIQVR